MPLAQNLESYYDGLDPEAVDRDVASGGVIPVGKYHARLDGASAKTANSGNEGYELEFTIIAGPYTGSVVKDTVWDSEKARNRLVLFMHRLGLLTVVEEKGQKKYQRVEGKDDFSDCLGTECVIDVTQEEWTSGTKKGVSNRLAFAGVYTLDDPKVQDVLHPTTKSAPATKSAPPVQKPKPKPKDDFSDL